MEEEKAEIFFQHLFEHNLGYAAELDLSPDDVERILQITDDALRIILQRQKTEAQKRGDVQFSRLTPAATSFQTAKTSKVGNG